MRALSLAVRGLWWRRGSSLTLLLLASVCVAVAAFGPAYLTGARDAVVRAALRQAAPDAFGTGVTVGRGVTRNDPQLDALLYDVTLGFGDVLRSGEYAAPIGSIDVVVHIPQLAADGTGIRTPLVYRAGACDHVVIRSGSCVGERDPRGVMLTSSTAATFGVTVGSSITFADFVPDDPATGSLQVRGIYEPKDPSGPYWFAPTHGYFAQSASTDAVLVPERTWSEFRSTTTSTASSHADLTLDADAVSARTLPGLTTALQVGTAREHELTPATAQTSTDVVTTNLPSVAFGAGVAQDSLAIPIASVAGQLVVLTIAVLFLVMVSSAESRASELALGKLHGLRPRPAVLHAVLEPFLLLAAAVPLGVGLCTVVLDAVSGAAFGSTANAAVDGAAWLAAVAAAMGGAVAAVIAATSSLRRPVLEQWRRAERRPGRRAFLVEGLVAALAVGGVLALVRQRSGGDGGSQILPIIAPALLAVAFALVGARLLPLLARIIAAATRGRRSVALFVAVRQVARRRDDVRVFALLCTTVALLVFGLSSGAVFDLNRLDRAHVEVGADRVIQLAASGSDSPDVVATVARLDPSGQQAAAVYADVVAVEPSDELFGDNTDLSGSTAPVAPTLLVVDPDRFAAVTSASDGPPLPDLRTPLRTAIPRSPDLVAFTGTSLDLVGQVRVRASEPVRLVVGLTDSVGAPFDVAIATLTDTANAAAPVDLRAAVPRCANRCLLRRLALYGTATSDQPIVTSVDLSAADVTAADGTVTSILPALRAASWSSLNEPSPGTPVVDSVQTTSTDLLLGVTAVGPPDDDALGFGALADVATTLPAVVTSSVRSTLIEQAVVLNADSGDPITVNPSVTVDVLPQAGANGVVVSRDWFAASHPLGYAAFAPNQVWLTADAPGDFATRLTAAGVRVTGERSVATRARELSQEGPSFAVAMLRFGGVAAAALAVAGSAASLFVAARRRLFELAALRTLGVRSGRMTLALVAEQTIVIVAGAAAGLGAGLLGARLALPAIPEFSDPAAYPLLRLGLPVGLAVLAALVATVVAIAVAAVGDAFVVRRAGVGRLREAQT